ncbi:hypothetical protein SAMN02745121_00465 [Nannocystis exedens]|uniref:Dolichyl-phosphate-mannose-protein mannosyltransferase n=2 Tax=Nannocystis exedens TaxID=54 RepID=A0A1I1TA83_9BACT|nr:hypothetical protein NAEX_09400 [Nannocystis exedens]SFD53213.1 hypothetical protein SAMN02745121_00465 [Nannocystis exedens]
MLLPGPEPLRERLCLGLTLALAAAFALVELLGALGWLTAPAGLVGCLGFAGAVTRRAGLAAAGRDAAALGQVAIAAVRGPWALAAVAGIVAVGLASLAALWLESWGWDALAYHLPPVHDALQTGRVRELPTHVTYARAYPQAVERVLTLWRLLLPDETLVDLGQLPFAVAGAAGLATLARRAGVRPGRAAGLALAWWATPVLMLQLAHAYVDVAHAALAVLAVVFVTGPVDRGRLVGAALALGLFLGSKPSAPLPFALLAATLWIRSGLRWPGALAAIAAGLVIGGESYARGWLQHGNPVWPVALQAGPIALPGPVTATMFFAVLTPPGFAELDWWQRLAASWTALPGSGAYGYDMRLGLHGPLHLLLPPAIVSLAFGTARRARGPVALLAVVSLATPAAFWPRFTLALPGALLVALAAGSEGWPRRARALLDGSIGALALVGVGLAAPGFTPDGPPIWALGRATPLQRAEAATSVGQARAWLDARAQIGEGECFAYDESVEVPGLLWRPDGRGRVAYVPPELVDGPALSAWLAAEEVRAIAVDRRGPRAAWLRERPDRFTPLFACRTAACEVFAVRREDRARSGR